MPRARVAGAGLPGSGQAIFTDAAKADGRYIGLDSTATVMKNTETDDGAGSPIESWEAGETVPCRIDIFSRMSQSKGEVADRIDEHSTHIVTLPPGTDVDTDDRLVIEEETWAVTAIQSRSGAASMRAEVRGVITP